MTAYSLRNRPAPWWLRELAHGRAAYEELLGWPVTVRVTDRALVLPAGPSVSAVTMPSALGSLVRQELRLAMQSGPIATDPDGLNWTFLARPPEHLRPGVAGALEEAAVHLATRGCQVHLPTSPTETSAGRRRWIEQPVPNRSLPPAYPVIAIIRRLTEPRKLAA